ncbi:MAG: heme o synthase [Candidatus Heimdallarchaeaceae archaeon]
MLKNKGKNVNTVAKNDSPLDSLLKVEEEKTSKNNFFLPISLYMEIIKARQTFLLLFTSYFAYLISAWPQIELLNSIWLLLSMFLAISGSTMLNMYIDRDIDKIMERTKHRALPSGKISEKTVLAHGIVFTIAGITVAGFTLNYIVTILIFLGAFFNVVIYTLWLKRRTHFSIIFGGVGGGIPAITGRAVVTGNIDLIGILMGIFIFAWIPLHFLTLALIPKNVAGYRKAGVPMWPVVRSKKETIIIITVSALVSTFAAIGTSIVLQINLVTLILTMILGAYFIVLSIWNLIKPTEKLTWRLFKQASMFMAGAFLLWFLGVVFQL